MWFLRMVDVTWSITLSDRGRECRARTHAPQARTRAQRADVEFGIERPNSLKSSRLFYGLTRLDKDISTADDLVEVVDADNVQTSALPGAGRRIPNETNHPQNTVELLAGG